MGYVKVSSKHQITLPKAVREALGIGAGDRLSIAVEGDKVVLRPLPKVSRPTDALYGSVESEKDAVEAVRAFREAGGRA